MKHKRHFCKKTIQPKNNSSSALQRIMQQQKSVHKLLRVVAIFYFWQDCLLPFQTLRLLNYSYALPTISFTLLCNILRMTALLQCQYLLHAKWKDLYQAIYCNACKSRMFQVDITDCFRAFFHQTILKVNTNPFNCKRIDLVRKIRALILITFV